MTSQPSSPTGPRPAAARGKRPRLAPSQKYEIYTSVLTSSATQRELAEKYGVDRTTIRSICATAKQGALQALAAAVPGRRGKSPEQAELEAARREIERLQATVCEQAVTLHLEREKKSPVSRGRPVRPENVVVSADVVHL
jgi:transposase-like protein